MPSRKQHTKKRPSGTGFKSEGAQKWHSFLMQYRQRYPALSMSQAMKYAGEEWREMKRGGHCYGYGIGDAIGQASDAYGALQNLKGDYFNLVHNPNVNTLNKKIGATTSLIQHAAQIANNASNIVGDLSAGEMRQIYGHNYNNSVPWNSYGAALNFAPWQAHGGNYGYEY